MRTALLLFLALLQSPTTPGKPTLRTAELTPQNGAELATALATGGTIKLLPNTTYVGNFVARKSFTLDTQGATDVLRASPTNTYARLASTNGGPALVVTASNVRIKHAHFERVNAGDVISVGYGDSQQATLAQVPRNVYLDQIVVLGNPAGGTKRGVVLQCGDCGVTNSYIDDLKVAGQDSQAIGSWNGPGPFLIKNNFLRAAGENIMFGGDNPRIPDLVPENITIADNYVTKDLAWRQLTWTVKNLLEFKAGRHVTVTNNIFENLWQGGQPGWSIVLTPQGLASVQVSDIRFTDNTVRSVSSGFNILGYAQIGSSLQTCDIVIENNWFQLSKALYGGQGWFMQIGAGLSKTSNACNISVTHNTIEQDGNQFIAGTGSPVTGYQFLNNIVSKAGAYGIFLQDAAGVNQPYGKNWQQYFPGGVIEDNTIIAAPSALKTNVPNNNYVAAGTIVAGRGQGELAGYGRR